ncbi:hypothetical protein ES708_21785 [subsurface metagenome]
MKIARQYHASAGREVGIARAITQGITLKPFLPSLVDLRPFGIDVWEGDGYIDFEKVAEFGPPKVEFVMVRMGQSWGREDKKFERNWRGFKGVGIPRMSYHVVFPSQEVIPQVENVCRIFDRSGNGDLGEGPAWIDSQLVQGQTREKVSVATISMVRGVEGKLEKEAGVYTGKWHIEENMEIQDWFGEIFWWLATWLWPKQTRENQGPPRKVDEIPWKNVLFHQSASWGDGLAIGSQAKRIDYNRFIGTWEKMRELFKLGPHTGEQKAKLELKWETIRDLEEAIKKAR